MPGRRFLIIVASVFLAAALVALVLWLGSQSDTALARWSSIATVFAAVVAVLALAAAVVPLLRHDSGAADAKLNAPEAPTVIHQKIIGKSVNAAGRDQYNFTIGDRDKER